MLYWIVGWVASLFVAFLAYCCCRAAGAADRRSEEDFQQRFLPREKTEGETLMAERLPKAPGQEGTA